MATPTANKQQAINRRYERYKAVLDLTIARESFHLDEVKQACVHEQPAFVTRIINDLEQNGWIVKETDSNAYRWNPGRGKFSANHWLDEKIFGRRSKSHRNRNGRANDCWLSVPKN